MKEKGDKYLVERISKGDRHAFRCLFERYFPMFLSFARSLLKDDMVADDLVQNVFVRLWTSREKLDADRSIRNYLLVSVRNEVFCYLRANRIQKVEALQYDVMDESSDIHDKVAAKDMERDISYIIEDMPDRRKEIFRLSRNEKLSNKEIAQRLGLSVRTVEKHIENALSDIRHKFPN